MADIPYPNPVLAARVERMVDDLIGRGMTRADMTRDDLIAFYQRRVRLKDWIRAMDVEPTPESRRQHGEAMRKRYHDRIRQEREGKDEA